MEMSLTEWLKRRGLAIAVDGLPAETDIQFIPIFPVVYKADISGRFLQWLIDPEPEETLSFT
jgi:hypothetical protein